VNRFRGDPALFTDGVRFLEERSALPVLGVVPWLDVRLPAEDSLELDRVLRSRPDGVIDIAVVHLARISNFDELEPLAAEPGVSLRLVSRPELLGRPDLVVLPGSKTTVADLRRLRESGLADALLAARAAGSAVLGICGGFQMLGREIRDPAGVESSGGGRGLGLLPVDTTFGPVKVTSRRRGRVLRREGLLGCAGGLAVSGYEIHMGRIAGAAPAALEIEGMPEGAVSEDGWTVGSSLHGLLGGALLRRAVLEALARRRGVPLPPPAPPAPDPLDRLADALEQSLDMPALERIAGLGSGR
jgi:adenosylcobyric acid synthase